MFAFKLSKGTKSLLVVSTFITLYVALSLSLFTQDSFQIWLLTLSPQDPLSGSIIFLLLCALSSIGVPRQVIAFTCGYLFNFYYGALFATIAVTIGALITLYISRLFHTMPLLLKYESEMAKITTFLSAETFKKAIIIRLLPIGSNFVTNIVAGVAYIPVKPYIAGSFIGYIPQMVIFSLAGSGVKMAAMQQVVISVVLFMVAMLLSWQLYRSSKNKQTVP